MARRGKNRGRPIHGWVLIDKPEGITSSDVVNKVRRHLDAAKAGHGGTLDPLATGLLPIALGEATKMVSHALHGEKTYDFTLRWGVATMTEDAEGEVIASSEIRPTETQIREALPQFIGLIAQKPPRFSAIRIQGKRAYDLARAGVDMEMEPRPVEIFVFDLMALPDQDHAQFRVTCGAGTYVRALARDLGEALGTHAHVTALRRTEVAVMQINDAIKLDDFLNLSQDAAEAQYVRPIAYGLDDIPALALTPEEAQKLRQGQPLSFIRRPDQARLQQLGLDQAAEDFTALAMDADHPVAMVKISGPEIRAMRVFNL